MLKPSLSAFDAKRTSHLRAAVQCEPLHDIRTSRRFRSITDISPQVAPLCKLIAIRSGATRKYDGVTRANSAYVSKHRRPRSDHELIRHTHHDAFRR